MASSVSEQVTALAVDVASGAAAAGQALLYEAHAAFNGFARAELALAEAVGGVIFEMDWAAAALSPRNPPPAISPGEIAYVRGLVAGLRVDVDAAPWRAPIFGVRTLKLPAPGLRLLRLPGGASLPEHGHGGEELTLVLSGAFADESGCFGPGELVFADAGLSHTPRAMPGRDCVCLIYAEGPMRFRGPVESLIGRFIWE